MFNHKTIENRYRHYKGGIYYRIGVALLSDSDHCSNFVLEANATFETTGEKMQIYVNGETGCIYAAFVDRIATEDEFLKKVIIYQSEDSKTFWVRLKDEFEGFNGQGVKRFTLANL